LATIESGKKGDSVLVVILIIGGVVTTLFAAGGVYLGVKFAKSIFLKRASLRVSPMQMQANNNTTMQKLDMTDASPNLQLESSQFNTSNLQSSPRKMAYQRINMMKSGAVLPQ